MAQNPQMEISFRDIAATSYLLRDRVVQTQCVKSQLTNYLKCKSLHLKLEYKQNGGSYKTRGAFNALMTIPKDERRKGVVTACQGNHGVALSYAGRKLGIPITVLLPKLAPVSKVQTCRKYGSKVIVDGEDVHEAVIKAAELARNQNQKFINIFSNFALGVGNATAAIEMAQQVPKMDYCILPITLEKGILNGMKVAIKKLCPCCKIYAVKCSSKSSAPMSTDDNSIVDRVIEISEDDILTAFLLLVEVEKVLVEPSSAMALAALTSRKYPEFQDKNVVCFLPNGNVDLASVTKLLERSNIIPMNSITFSVSILDEVGALEKLCAEVSKNQVSIKDIVFPRNSNNEKMILFCETTGPEHAKTFIRSMLSVYSDFQVIPLRSAGKDQRLEGKPFYFSSSNGNNIKSQDNLDRRNLDQRQHSFRASKDSTESRYGDTRKGGSGGINGRNGRDAMKTARGLIRPFSPPPVPLPLRSYSNIRDPKKHRSTSKHSQYHDSNLNERSANLSREPVHNEGTTRMTRNKEGESREKHGKRAKNRSQDDSQKFGDDNRDSTHHRRRDDNSAIIAGEFEQVDHHKIYTVDRYDDQLSPLESTRMEEKRSVSKTVGRYDRGASRCHVDTIDKFTQSTIISRQECQKRQPGKSSTARTQHRKPEKPEKSSDSLKKDRTQDSRADYTLSCTCLEDPWSSDIKPEPRVQSFEKSDDSMEKPVEDKYKSSRGDCTCPNKPDSSDTFEIAMYSARNQPKLDSWILSTDTMDGNIECRRSTISVSEQNLHDGKENPQISSRVPPKLKKCRIDSCPFIDQRDRSTRSPPTDDKNLYCECGKKIVGCTRQTCPAYKGKSPKDLPNVSKESRLAKLSRNGTTSSQKLSKSSQSQDRSKNKDMDEMSGLSTTCTSSSDTSISENLPGKVSTQSARLDAGADEFHSLFHDGDYEECHCSKTAVSALPYILDFGKRQNKRLSAAVKSSLKVKKSFSDFEATLPNTWDFI